MNSFKRIIGTFVVLALCIGMFSGSTVYAAVETSDNEISAALELLRLFEIIPDYSDYNIPYDREVSRAEFADTAAKLMNMRDYKGASIYYYDVPRTHFAYDSICALTEMGIINGTTENKFEPDAPIEDAAAYKIILSIMGYGDFAYHNGGYPSGYITAARRTEVYVDSSSANLTHEEMLRIMYNALTAYVLEPVVYSADGGYSIAEASENETLLSVYYDVYNDIGVVSGADCISLGDTAPAEKNQAVVDGVLYNTETDLSEYLGEETEFFYRKASETEKTILWARSTGASDVLRIDVDNDAKFDEESFVFTYADGNKNSRISLSRSLMMVYNGRVTGFDYREILNQPRYRVKLVKQNGVYNIAIVYAHENIVADVINAMNMTVYDKINVTKPIELNENAYEYLSVKRSDGSDVTISEINRGDVLSVFKSKDGMRIEVIVESVAKSGVIASMIKDDNGYEATIGEDTFYIPNSVYKDNLGVGDSVKLYLDYTGIVAYAEIETGRGFAAYVADMATEELFGETVKLKMFRQDGSIAVYDCADKVTVDGKSGNAKDVKDALMENGEFSPQLILAQTDSKGRVREIDTAFVNEETESIESSLSPNLEYAERHYKIHGFFGPDAAIDDNTILFGVPKDENISSAEDSDFRIIKKSELRDDMMMSVMSYNATDRVGYEQYVVVKEDSAMAYGQELPILVTNIGSMLGDDGVEVECVQGYQGKTSVTVPSDGRLTLSDLKEGMLVRFRFTRSGAVADKTILFDPSSPKPYYTTVTPFNNVYGVEVGFVNDIIGDVIKIGYGSGAGVDHVSNMYGTPPIIVYDSTDDRNPVYAGSFGDARTYRNAKEDCSRVVMISKHCTPLLYVFYN